jgi:hypothetical protein
MWHRKNWVSFFYLHSIFGLCCRWLYASAATCALGFPEFLKKLSHFCQFLLQFISVVRCMIEIFCEAILDHSGDHLSIILHDRIVWCCSLCLCFLAWACCLYNWSLSSPWFLCDGVWAVSVLPQPVSTVHWLAEWFLSSPSGSLAALSCRLPGSTCFGPFFIFWVLGFAEAVFPPA